MRLLGYWTTPLAETVLLRSESPRHRRRRGLLFMLGLAEVALFPSMVTASTEEDPAQLRVVAAATSPTSAGAIASDDASPATSSSDTRINTLEEVIVTAQKRASRLQDTPIAVSAFTPDSIERNRIQGLEDIALRTPSVTFVQLNKGEAYVSIRGTLVNTPGAGWDDSVTTFIDDVPMTGAGDNSPDLYDLKSIEVLRGPQGTLFGRNVTGGAIVIHTLEPSFQEEGKAEVTYGSDNLAQFRGLWSGPLVGDQLAGKLTLDFKHRDDYLRNVTLNDKTYGDSVGNGRGQLLWEPSDTVRVLFSGDYTHDQSSGKIVRLSGSLEPSLYPNLTFNPDETNQGQNSATRKNVLGVSARVDWDAPWGTLTSITGLRSVHNNTNWSRLGDPDNQALQTAIVEDKQYTEELRAASASSGRLTWLGGLFYLHADKKEQDQFTSNLNPATANGGAFPVPVIGVGQDVGQKIVDEVGAVFGEVRYTIVDALKLTLGGRGQWERKSGSSSIVTSSTPGIPFDPFYPLIFPDAAADYSHTWYSFTPKATLDYQLHDGLLLYATAAKGYKSGGWDTSASSDYGRPSAEVAQHLATPFQPETVRSYEIGSKYLSGDRRWQVNAAAFIADYGNMQTNQFNPQTAVFQTTNAGKARAKGLELETTEAVTNWLTLGLNYTYQLARYTDYVQSATQNNTGHDIPETPKHSVNLSAETRFTLPAVPGYVNAGGDYTYRTAVHFADSNAEPAYLLEQSKFDGIVNLHLTWSSAGDTWHVGAFASNLTNRHTVAYATDVSGFYLTPAEAANPANSIFSVIRIPTRVVGVTVRHEF
jgi:iron complex outermembrane recepter protein